MSDDVEFEIGSSGPIPRETHYKVPTNWRIEVRSAEELEHRFRAALAIDSELRVVEWSAPFDLEFTASKFTAFFEVEGSGSLEVNGYSDAEGQFRRICGFGAAHGKLIFDPYGFDGRILCGAGTGF